MACLAMMSNAMYQGSGLAMMSSALYQGSGLAEEWFAK